MDDDDDDDDDVVKAFFPGPKEEIFPPENS